MPADFQPIPHARTYGPLTEPEKRVILEKGTEPRFSGRYDHEFAPGVYCCRACGTPLYVADDKFDSGCGWPAFEAEVPGAVSRNPDADGRRTEICCRACGGHLGHLFAGERLTPKNARHCVNSLALVYEPPGSSHVRRVAFAGGCFWGVESLLRQRPGVLAAVSGYCGGETAYPTYADVCTGTTGHAEAVVVFYDPDQTNFTELTRFFLEIHDPTQLNRQGPDLGSQYRSAIFHTLPEERQCALDLLDILRRQGLNVQTEVLPLLHFWPAEEYHQNYYDKNGQRPYCHVWQKRF